MREAGSQKSRTVKVATAFAIAAALLAVLFAVLYFGARTPTGTAAEVNGSAIAESDVDAYISRYRVSHSLTDDNALAKALSSQGLSVAEFRINAINQIALARLVDARAEELGVMPSNEAVQKKVDEAKASLAFGDDSIWQRTLQQYGMTEEQVRDENRDNLARSAVLEKEVPRKDTNGKEKDDATWNSDCADYLAKLLAQAKITYYPLPDDAAYDVDVSSTSSQNTDNG